MMLDKSMFVSNYSNEIAALQVGSSVKMHVMTIFRRVRKIAKSDCQFRHVCPAACLSVRIEQLGSI
jgi:hypothetical protein